MTRAISIVLLVVVLWGNLSRHLIAEDNSLGFDEEIETAFDSAIRESMKLADARSATVAVSRNGELLYSTGYGWRDQKKQTRVSPTALFRIASVSKPITAAAIKTAIRTKKITLETKVFDFLEMSQQHGESADARLNDITVEHLLKHEGGWDRDIGFDPMFQGVRILQTTKPNATVTANDVVAYMWQQPLQFTPGEKSAYSNFGYCVLGRVLAKVYSKPYLECIQELILEPHGIEDIKLGTSNSTNRPEREVEYPINDNRFLLDVMDAHGGLIASAPALCQFLDAYWISGEPREPGKNFTYTFFGSLPGTTAMVRQRSDGVNIAVLLNGRRDDRFYEDLDALKKAVDRVFDESKQSK